MASLQSALLAPLQSVYYWADRAIFWKQKFTPISLSAWHSPVAPLSTQNEVSNSTPWPLRPYEVYYSLGSSPPTILLAHTTSVILAFLLFCDHTRHHQTSGPSHLAFPLAAVPLPGEPVAPLPHTGLWPRTTLFKIYLPLQSLSILSFCFSFPSWHSSPIHRHRVPLLTLIWAPQQWRLYFVHCCFPNTLNSIWQ